MHHMISLLNFLRGLGVRNTFSHPITSSNSPAGREQAFWSTEVNFPIKDNVERGFVHRI